MVLQLSVLALSWIYTKYIHREIVLKTMKRGKKQTEDMKKQTEDMNKKISNREFVSISIHQHCP